MIDLKNLNVLLTGATGIIGGSILQKLHQVNANIIATGTNPSKLQKIEEQYSNITIKKFDISNHSKIESFVDECNEIFNGKLDVLINNAGITSDNLSIRMKDDEWNKVINLNLSSSFFLSKYTIKKMLKNKNGKIINITSIVGLTGNPGQANYAASKAGLIGMTQSIAKEVGTRGITVNCIAPGWIDTEMTEELPENSKRDLLDRIPIGKIGKPENIAHAAVFLASDEASYITGQTITVDGGRVIN